MSYMELGLVVATYPEGMSVDVLLDSDGSRLSNVQVMTMGTDRNGDSGLPDIGGPQDDSRWDPNAPRALYMRAVVGFLRGGLPVVQGFLAPQVTEITFADKNRQIRRHPSDVYTSIDDEGNFELFHPSGTYVRIGTDGAHEDLTGKDFDGRWKIARNTDKAVYVHMSVANAGEEVAVFDLDPSGNLQLGLAGSVDATILGDFQADITGTAVWNAPAGTTVNGPLTVNGPFEYTQGMTGSGGGSIQGELFVDDIGVTSHHHIEQGDGQATSDARA